MPTTTATRPRCICKSARPTSTPRPPSAARIIPAGDAIQIARAHPAFRYPEGGKSLNRDGYHASWTHGRYLIALVWVETLTGLNLTGNSFVPVREDAPELTPSPEELAILKACAHRAVEARRAIRL